MDTDTTLRTLAAAVLAGWDGGDIFFPDIDAVRALHGHLHPEDHIHLTEGTDGAWTTGACTGPATGTVTTPDGVTVTVVKADDMWAWIQAHVDELPAAGVHVEPDGRVSAALPFVYRTAIRALTVTMAPCPECGDPDPGHGGERCPEERTPEGDPSGAADPTDEPTPARTRADTSGHYIEADPSVNALQLAAAVPPGWKLHPNAFKFAVPCAGGFAYPLVRS